MQQTVFGAALFALSLLSMCAEASPAPDFPLLSADAGGAKTFRALGSNWRKLIVFAPEGRNLGIAGMKWNAARAKLAEPEFGRGLAERDVVVIVAAREEISLAAGVKSARVPAEAIPATRTAFALGEGDGATVLVGKDGEIAQVWRGHLDPAAIFAAIDAMPMRQAEKRERSR